MLALFQAFPILTFHLCCNNTQKQKSGKKEGKAGSMNDIRWTQAGHREGGAPTAKYTRLFVHSTLLLVRTPDVHAVERISAFKLSASIFDCGPLLPYIHLVSTHMMNAPRSFPVCAAVHMVYYCNYKWKVGSL